MLEIDEEDIYKLLDVVVGEDTREDSNYVIDLEDESADHQIVQYVKDGNTCWGYSRTDLLLSYIVKRKL